ncbi:MAG: TolC family outer membrane protein [Rhodospirillales bacterium]|nr:TolC family outer membrane protein [Rhodospirillales bacterium]
MIRRQRHSSIGTVALGVLVGAGALFAGLSAYSHDAGAQTLEEALVQAYQNNPTLQAERARLRAVDEEVPAALAGWQPTVEIAGDLGASYSKTEGTVPNAGSHSVVPHGVGLTATAPLYQGGRVSAQIDSAESRVNAGRAQLQAVEQSILLSTVNAYMDVLRYDAEIELSRSSERVVGRQLQAARDRLEVGEVTRTDVAQAEARLAQAGAERVAAEGGMMSARAMYQQVTGRPPGTLSWPPVPMGLPETEEDALSSANDANPSIRAASFIAQAAQADIETAAAALRPQVSIVGDVRQRFDTSDLIEQTTDASIRASVRVPLYQGGAASARIRQSKQIAAQRLLELDQSRRTVQEQVAQAWRALTSARAQIAAFESQVAAAAVALDGVEQETQVGLRTTLDVLDAEQEHFRAQINLIRTKREEIVAAYQVKASIGALTAQQLGLPVDLYDPEEHYRSVRDSSGGWLWSDE